MTRPIRVEYPGAIYHVISRGVSGMATFLSDFEREQFLKKARMLVNRGLLIVHAFCLMMNHFHLLCETPFGKLSRSMQQLLSQYSSLFNSMHDRKGHLWQSRYKAILVEDGCYFSDCSAYIHLNPVKAGLVKTPAEYRWSSYSSYIGLDKVFNWVSREKTLSYFEGSRGYRQFVEKKTIEELADPFKKAIAGIAFGSESFAGSIRKRIDKPEQPLEIEGLRRFLEPDPLRVDAIFDMTDSLCQTISPCQKRRMLVYGLWRFSGLTGSQVAKITGRTPQSVSSIWQDIEYKRRTNPQLAYLVETLEASVKNL